jgi:hypothetical protein
MDYPGGTRRSPRGIFTNVPGESTRRQREETRIRPKAQRGKIVGGGRIGLEVNDPEVLV